jgi:cytochrome c oxidase subunit II
VTVKVPSSDFGTAAEPTVAGTARERRKRVGLAMDGIRRGPIDDGSDWKLPGRYRSSTLGALRVPAARAAGPPPRAIGLVGICALLVAGCLPGAATTESRDVATLYGGFMLAAAAVAIIVYGLATFAIVRYRGGPDDPLPVQRRGNWRLEGVWTAIPIVTVLVLFAGTLLVLNRVDAHTDAPATEIRVQAFRWGWTFTYPNDAITISGIGDPGPEVVVPVGQPIRLTITSADVVHAFYVPLFLFKRDAIPGRENQYEFTVVDPGTYRGQCAEFCGVYHSRMPFALRAVSPSEYGAWLASQPRTTP